MNKRMPIRRKQAGLSIVELLVGVAVGLFIVGGSLKLFVDYLGNNRRLVLETRLNQDLRAAADLIARDLRRAGYWGNSTGGVVTTNAAPVPASSPYASVSPSAASGVTSTTTYSYSQGAENNTLDSAENFGFSLNSGVLQYLRGGTPQAITDDKTVTISSFSITPSHSCVNLQQYCTGSVSAGCAECTVGNGKLDANGCPTATCTGTGLSACPRITMRRFNIALQGTSPTDTKVIRNLQESVRVRNDQFTGACS